MNRLLMFGLMLVLATCAGCGDGLTTYPVTGKVLVRGAPAVAALVTLHPVGESKLVAMRPKGMVGADGGFSISTTMPDDGAPAGEYKVTIVWKLPADPKAAASLDPETLSEGTDRLLGKYSDPNTTPLTATVNAGSTELPPFDLP